MKNDCLCIEWNISKKFDIFWIFLQIEFIGLKVHQTLYLLNKLGKNYNRLLKSIGNKIRIKEQRMIEISKIQLQRQNNFLKTLNSLLHDIEALQPSEISLFILNNNRLNVQRHVVHLICTWFERFNGLEGAKPHQQRVKFIHCFDKLIRHKEYCDVINSCLVKIFCDAFFSYNEELDFQKLQDLKILFHIWSPFILPSNSVLIKNRVERLTKIDIYKQLKTSSRKFIKNYLSQQKTQFEKDGQEKTNPKRIVPEKLSEPRSEATTIERNSLSRQDQFWDMNQEDKRKNEFVQSQVLKKKRKTFTQAFPYQPNLVQVQIKQNTKLLSSKGEQLKQVKLIQTKVNSKIVQAEEKDTQLKVHLILEKLKKISLFKCNQCGKSLMTKQQFDLHLQMHFQQNMIAYNQSLIPKPRYLLYVKPVISTKKIAKPKQNMLNVIDWLKEPTNQDKSNNNYKHCFQNQSKYVQEVACINPNDKEEYKKVICIKDYEEEVTVDSFSNFYEQFKNDQINSLQYKTCYCCSENLRVSIQNSQFVYEDVIKVQSRKKVRLMHHDCYTMLMSTSQSELQQKKA